MPTVPMSQGAIGGATAKATDVAPKPTPEQLLMAAATMHEMGRLVEPVPLPRPKPKVGVEVNEKQPPQMGW